MPTDEQILSEAIRLVGEGVQVTLPVNGRSMYPFIIGGRESVVLVKPQKLRVGHVVLAQVEGGRHVVHRIVGIDGDRITLQVSGADGALLATGETVFTGQPELSAVDICNDEALPARTHESADVSELRATSSCKYETGFFGGKFLVEELEKYVNYDPLTHLLNRRSMDNYLQEAHRMAKTGMTPFCLLMMDIDDFKLINDTWGHECGDEVLRGVAKIVSSSVGKDDCVFRWGGEEILVLLKADEIIARRVAERIRIAIQKNTFEYNRTRIGVTITIGISAYSPEKGIQDMMNEADKKLYDGKRSGKNQVVF